MEIWKKVTHLNLPYELEVSNYGNIRKIIDGNIKDYKYSPNSRGYETVKLLHSDGLRYSHTIHRLVAITFLGLRPNLVINHIDGDKLNNHVSNLEWVTRSENCRHSKSISHLKRAREFSDDDVLNIINEYIADPIPMNNLSNKLGISRETLRTFFNSRSKKILSEIEYENLRKLIKENGKRKVNIKNWV